MLPLSPAFLIPHLEFSQFLTDCSMSVTRAHTAKCSTACQESEVWLFKTS